MRFLKEKYRFELNDTAMTALLIEITDFYRAGGVLSVGDWDQMSDEEKKTAIKARAAVRFEELVEERRIFGAQSAEELVSVAAEHDPTVKSKFELEKAVQEAAKRMNTPDFALENK